MQCTLFKKSALPSKKMAAAKPGAAPVGASILDNEDDTFVAGGLDAAGQPTDISALATLTASSDNVAIFTVDAPVGMTSKIHGLTVGTANLLLVATFTAGTPGPFNLSVPVTVGGSAAAGLTITFGTPVVRP